MHDVFHSSLLRIHVPNDDRLFPGRMDTQLGDSPDAKDEWAINLIKSHSGLNWPQSGLGTFQTWFEPEPDPRFRVQVQPGAKPEPLPEH